MAFPLQFEISAVRRRFGSPWGRNSLMVAEGIGPSFVFVIRGCCSVGEHASTKDPLIVDEQRGLIVKEHDAPAQPNFTGCWSDASHRPDAIARQEVASS